MASDIPSGSDPRTDALLRDSGGRWTLDPTGSRVEFHVKHFWGLITVHGHFEELAGEGEVAADGSVSGSLTIGAGSLTTKNSRRDIHLRSGDFFDSDNHPKVILSVRQLTPDGSGHLRARALLEAAGKSEELEPVVEVVEAEPSAVTLRSELVVDRTAFGMTWSPLGMASHDAKAVVQARFVRAG